MKKLYSNPDMKINRFVTENTIVTSGIVNGTEKDNVPDGYGTTSASFNDFGFIFN